MSSGMPPQIGMPDLVSEWAMMSSFFLRCNLGMNIISPYQDLLAARNAA